MNRINVRPSHGATLEMSLAELHIVKNALNETLNGIYIEEFETRLGASRESVSALLIEFRGIVAAVRADRDATVNP